MKFVSCSRLSPALRGLILTVLLSLGVQVSFGADLLIDVNPKHPNEGDTILLSVAFGGSVRNVMWYRESQRPENVILTYKPAENRTTPGPRFSSRERAFPSGSLQISKLLRSDSGKYILVLSLDTGDLQAETSLNVTSYSAPSSGGPTPGSTGNSSQSTGMPTWAFILVAIVAVVAVAAIIIGVVFVYKKQRSNSRAQKGISANNDLIMEPSDNYENLKPQNRRQLPGVNVSPPESVSPYTDLKYPTSSIYEELQ